MAPRTTPQSQIKAAILTPDQKRRAISRFQKRIEELRAITPQSIVDRFNDPHIIKVRQAIDRTLVDTFGKDTTDYNRYRGAVTLDKGNISVGGTVSSLEIVEGLRRGIISSIAILEDVIASLYEDLEEEVVELSAVSPNFDNERRVFVVHGHDEGAREAVARFLELIKLKASILLEQPNRGLTIIEKFENYASQVGFAVVLLTPDDVGRAVSAAGDQMLRARQNVIFELGYFAGRIGRDRVCLLRKGNIEGFSDLQGIIYTTMDAGGGWKLELARELKAAGFRVDLNKVF